MRLDKLIDLCGLQSVITSLQVFVDHLENP